MLQPADHEGHLDNPYRRHHLTTQHQQHVSFTEEVTRFFSQDFRQPFPYSGEDQVLWVRHGLHPRRVQVSWVWGPGFWAGQEQADRNRVSWKKSLNNIRLKCVVVIQGHSGSFDIHSPPRYPAEISNFKYKPGFPVRSVFISLIQCINNTWSEAEFMSHNSLQSSATTCNVQVRGIWWDSLHGNMLKVSFIYIKEQIAKCLFHRWMVLAIFSSAATAWSSSNLKRSLPNTQTNSSRSTCYAYSTTIHLEI